MIRHFIPTFLRNTLLDNVRKYVLNNISTVLYYPSTYEFIGIPDMLRREKLIDETLDPREYMLKYYSTELEKIFNLLYKKIKKGILYIENADRFLDGYPKARKRILDIFISLKSTPIIIGTSNLKLYTYLKKLGYAYFPLNELSLSETYNLVTSGIRIDKDRLDFSEGNLGVINLLINNQINEALEDSIINEILRLESGQRVILSLLSTRIDTHQLTKKTGVQTYVFLKRLMDRGEILRLGVRRGNYIVRNPLYRTVISNKVGYDKPLWYITGFLYLLIKLFLSIDKGVRINTSSNTIYVSPIEKIKRIDISTVRLMDITKTKYTVHLAREENLGRIDKFFRYEEDLKILIYPFQLTPSIVRKMRLKRIFIIDSDLISSLSHELMFPRKL